jgi:hypothetical protein
LVVALLPFDEQPGLEEGGDVDPVAVGEAVGADRLLFGLVEDAGARCVFGSRILFGLAARIGTRWLAS